MKPYVLAAFFAVTLAAPALAGQCQNDIAKVDDALSGKDVAVDVRTQVEDMRNQAVQLCGAGNEQEGIDILSEAKAMLAVD